VKKIEQKQRSKLKSINQSISIFDQRACQESNGSTDIT